MLMLLLANNKSVTAVRLTSTYAAAAAVDASLPARGATHPMQAMQAHTHDVSLRNANLHPVSLQSDASADNDLCNCCLITRLCWW